MIAITGYRPSSAKHPPRPEIELDSTRQTYQNNAGQSQDGYIRHGATGAITDSAGGYAALICFPTTPHSQRRTQDRLDTPPEITCWPRVWVLKQGAA